MARKAVHLEDDRFGLFILQRAPQKSTRASHGFSETASTESGKLGAEPRLVVRLDASPPRPTQRRSKTRGNGTRSRHLSDNNGHTSMV